MRRVGCGSACRPIDDEGVVGFNLFRAINMALSRYALAPRFDPVVSSGRDIIVGEMSLSSTTEEMNHLFLEVISYREFPTLVGISMYYDKKIIF